MKEENKQMMIDAIGALNTLGIPNNDIMIVGSIALDIHGLFPTNRVKAHDVDVVIRCGVEKQKQIIDVIKFVNKTVTEPNGICAVHSESSSLVMGLRNNLIINLWFVIEDAEFNTETKLENGVWVERPIDCFKKKKSYMRAKDYQDLNNIIQNHIL